MRLGKVAFERVFEESCGSAFGNPAVQRVGHPGWLQHPKTVQLREHVRRRTDLLSQTRTLGRCHLEWASFGNNFYSNVHSLLHDLRQVGPNAVNAYGRKPSHFRRSVTVCW